jgi:5'-nucleotidase
MKLVLTNDDGIEAPGLDALRDACAELGDCVVVAPAEALSGVSHRVTTDEPIAVVEEDAAVYRVHGTPADCVRIALVDIAPDAAWVLAGVNRGGNLGADVYLSGTVAAAREAALLGRASISLSQYVVRGREVDWTMVSRRAQAVLRLLFSRPHQPGSFWSVNLPHSPARGEEPEVVFCELDPSPLDVRYRLEGGAYVFEGDYHGRPRVPGRDVDVCFSGRVAVTRIPLDLSGRAGR